VTPSQARCARGALRAALALLSHQRAPAVAAPGERDTAYWKEPQFRRGGGAGPVVYRNWQERRWRGNCAVL